jgi:hypothetical protein
MEGMKDIAFLTCIVLRVLETKKWVGVVVVQGIAFLFVVAAVLLSAFPSLLLLVQWPS